MEKTFVFHLTSLDPAIHLLQISRILEKRTHLLSKIRYPLLWRWIERLNRVERAPEEVLRRRRIRSKIYGVILLLVGIFLAVPGLMEPQKLMVPLIAGTIAILYGIVALNRGKKRENPFDASAKRLLIGKDDIPAGKYTVEFRDDEMYVREIKLDADDEESEEHIPYEDFEYAIESENLLAVIYTGRITLLQKTDLEGEFSELRTILSEKIDFQSVIEE